MNRILIVDDDPGLCKLMKNFISVIGYEAHFARTLQKGLEKAKADNWDIVFLDVHLPDGNGLEAVTEFRNLPSAPEVIILTGEGTADGAEQAIRSGAWDYMGKPATLEKTSLTVKRAIEIRRIRASVANSASFKRDKIAGDSPELSTCLTLAAAAAASEAHVLITGETGTGKELFARAIHENSARANAPYVVVDCAALPESLVESVLFGHQKGAFTGADRSRTGLIQEANGGTLFLDEVGELSLLMQKRFLRVLQERRLRSVGGNQEVAVDFRLIAATHRDLDAMVSEKTFRKDLLFRLRSLEISLPALRDRHGDIQIIAMRTIKKYCTRFGMPVKGFYPEFLEALNRYRWPGNVRELIAAIEAAVVQAHADPVLHPIHLPLHIRTELARGAVENTPSLSPSPLTDTANDIQMLPLPKHAEHLNTTEKRYFSNLVAAAHGNIKEMCRISGLSRAQVYRLVKKHNISL